VRQVVLDAADAWSRSGPFRIDGAAVTADVFLILLVSHLLGDWVLQSDWQATNKPQRWAALTAHVASYHLSMGLLLLIPILRDGWPAWKGLVILTVSAGTHALVDRRWPVRALLRATASPGFATVEWGVIAVDQAVHLCILALLAVLLG
jgi:Protein of unknown function (DUF3307)